MSFRSLYDRFVREERNHLEALQSEEGFRPSRKQQQLYEERAHVWGQAARALLREIEAAERS